MSEGKKNRIENVKIDLPVDDNLMDLIDELTGDDEDVINLEDEADALSPQDADGDIIDLSEMIDDDDEDLIDLMEEAEDEILDLEEPATDLEPSDDSLILLTEEDEGESGADLIDMMGNVEDDLPGWIDRKSVV